MIAHAPDQWGAVFAPIWPDLEAEAAGEVAGDVDEADAPAPDPSAASPADDPSRPTPSPEAAA